jgi:two-component system nitrate/nitrite response regulator NarL
MADGTERVKMSEPMRDAPVASHRIVARTLDKARSDVLKAFLESRAPELTLELIENDDDLRRSLATGTTPALVLWCQQPSEIDAISSMLAAFAKGRRPPVALMVDRYDASLVSRALAHGIAGLVTQQMSADMLLCVLRLLLTGGTYFPCEPAWFAPAPAPLAASAEMPALAQAGLRRGAYGLTPRQLDVLGYICQGMSNKIIARALGMRETTVKAHVMQIMRRLNADNRTQVALRVSQMGFTTPIAAAEPGKA